MDERSMKNLNLAFRFILELIALAAVFLFGLSLSDELVIGLIAGLVLVIGVLAVWGLFVAPKASRRLSDPTRLAVEVIVWSLAVLALGFAASWLLAAMFGLAVLISLILMFLWGQRGR